MAVNALQTVIESRSDLAFLFEMIPSKVALSYRWQAVVLLSKSSEFACRSCQDLQVHPCGHAIHQRRTSRSISKKICRIFLREERVRAL